jgi:hypothetical protein
MVRHATHHFVLEEGPSHLEMLGQLNWAEQPHNAIGDHVMEVIKRKAHVEGILEKRAKTQK